jgi:hypothetical protein
MALQDKRKVNVMMKTATLGALVVGLYAVLFLAEDPILRLSTQGGWMFVLPLIIAFLFSFVHGAFTANFWDVLGIKANAAAGSK